MLRRITPVFLILLAAALSSAAADRSAVILFGPAGAENARSGARLVSSILSKFVAGGTAEIRGTGVVEGQLITSAMPGKQIDELTSKTARDSRETSPALFVTALDAAAQAAARMSGNRVLIAVVQNPPLSGEAETALQQVRDFCRANGVRVVLVDVSDPSGKSTSAAFKSLIAETAGSLAGNAKTLQAALDAAPVRTLAKARTSEPPAPESKDIKVLTRFIRVSPRGTQSYGVERHTTAFAGNLTTTEGGNNVELGTGPVRGMFLVESPLSGLQFDKDDNSQTYTAKARVTQVARNKDGRAVWTARKEVTIHGPLAKLEARRAGNLYYLRDVLLPGGRYTLEATVEDLLANKTGTVREPLRTGDGLPGFYVSDAVCVRPFSGSVDRFEADQVFSYDGNAISPLLNPVFQPGEPFNLQIYFVMYPDLYGPQPKLSLEILQNGKVLGRTPIPFTDSLRDNSREGQGSIQGEQKRQFPYIASLKNAKLTPGDFEARITIQQDKNIITRSVPFRVLGNGQTAADLAPAPSVGSASPPVDEDAGFVMPEIDPVALRAGGPSLPAEETERLWQAAAAGALNYSAHLPNFRCTQETRRLTAPAKNADRLRIGDVIVDELTFENGKESYRTLEINGLKADTSNKPLDGVRSRGEFGTMLKALFNPEVGTKYKWAGRAMAAGVLCQVFDVEVAPEKSNFVLTHNMRQEVPGYQGRVYIDEESGMVRRLTIAGQNLPKDFALQSPSMSLEYGMVRVGQQDYLLPLRSVLQVRQGRSMVRNETEFRGYHKFEASSVFKY